MRKISFVTGEIYHIYNRGVDKGNIVHEISDTNRFLKSLKEFNSIEPIGSLFELSFENNKRKDIKPLVKVIAYCVNPNHYHLLLKQVVKDGISKLMKRLNGGYSWYLNNKYKRIGPLYQGPFKAIHVRDNNYLLHLSAYINQNNKIHQLGDLVAKLAKSSMREYENGLGWICDKGIILEQFKNSDEYSQFCKEALKDILEKRTEDKEWNVLLAE